MKGHACSSAEWNPRRVASRRWWVWLAMLFLGMGAVFGGASTWGRPPLPIEGSGQDATKASPSPAAKQPTIQLQREGQGKAAFLVTGLDPADLAQLAKTELKPDQWTALFAVYVDRGATADQDPQPAILGSYQVAAEVLRFEPRFPLALGLRYRAVLDLSRMPGRSHAGKSPLVAEFTVPKPPVQATTVVQQVYPSRATLPENQLKFYIHFSAPMSRGEAYDRVQLLDGSGKPMDTPFLELGQELWDPQGKRFTLFFDPGRIKRGLKPREDLGPVLEEGKSYTLVIDRQWSDAEGNPLKESYRKAFRVGPPDEQSPDPKTWKLQSPQAGRVDPLVVDLPEPLDHALLERVLRVTDAQGQTIPGIVTITQAETRWQFTPQQTWRAGRYQLVVETTLEDLAGNQIGRLFEVDVLRPIERQAKAETVAIPFQVERAPGR